MGYFSKFWLKITRWPSIHQSVDTGAFFHLRSTGITPTPSKRSWYIVMRAASQTIDWWLIWAGTKRLDLSVPLMCSHGARFVFFQLDQLVGGSHPLLVKQPVWKNAVQHPLNRLEQPSKARHLCVILNHRGPVRHAKKSNFPLPQSFKNCAKKGVLDSYECYELGIWVCLKMLG